MLMEVIGCIFNQDEQVLHGKDLCWCIVTLTLVHNDCERVFFSFDLIVAASAAALVDTKWTTHTDEKVN